jgi:hypothetical protein
MTESVMTTRHLYNNTDESWQVTFQGGSLPDLQGATQQPDGNWQGTIAANGTCALEFDQNGGMIYLQSAKGTNWSYRFSTNDLDADPSWDHDGDTPGARLNDPADGDFQIDQDVPQEGDGGLLTATVTETDVVS